MSNQYYMCVVFGCVNSEEEAKALTFHKFPADHDAKWRWDVVLKDRMCPPVWLKESNWRVCSKHFKSSDFLSLGKLKHDAVPSLLTKASTVDSLSTRVSTPLCVVLGCANSDEGSNDSSRTFHKFPTEYGVKQRWDLALKGHKWAPVWIKESKWRVCSEHFMPSDFHASGKLKRDAVPSLLKRSSTVGSWYSIHLPTVSTTKSRDSSIDNELVIAEDELETQVPLPVHQDPSVEPSELTIVETIEQPQQQRSASPVDPALPPKLPRPLAYMTCSEVRTALCKVLLKLMLVAKLVIFYGCATKVTTLLKQFAWKRCSGTTTGTSCRSTATGRRCRRGGRTTSCRGSA